MRFVFLALVSFGGILPAFASSGLRRDASQILTPDIDAFILNVLSEWGSPGGVSVAAVKMGDNGSWIVDTKGYGNATSNGTPIDSDTMLCIGSNSKQFNAIATGLLVANETLSPRLTLATKIASIFPDSWKLMDEFATSQSTMIDLFSHRTGLPRHDFSYSLNDTVPEILSRIRYMKPSLEFRDGFQYNNIMYAIMSYLPTALLPSKIPFARYVKEHIFDPLGLSATYSPDVAAQGHVLAQGFGKRGVNATAEGLFTSGTPMALEYWSPGVTEDGNALSGAGGVIMTAKDAATWLQTLLLGGVNPATGEQVIPADVISVIATGYSVVTSTGAPVLYGAGQELGTYEEYPIVEHGGDVTGFHSIITRVPSANVGVSVFTNDDTYGPYFIQVIRYRILDALLGLNATDWDSYAKGAVSQALLKNATLPPNNASDPSIAYTDLAGTYSNDGYGAIDFCYVANSSSGACADVLAVLPDVVAGLPTLVARWDKFWASHISLQHFDGDVWNLTLLASRHILNGERTGEYWTAPMGSALAEFAKDGSGFGISGGFWGAGFEPTGDTLQESSEVWFTKSD